MGRMTLPMLCIVHRPVKVASSLLCSDHLPRHSRRRLRPSRRPRCARCLPAMLRHRAARRRPRLAAPWARPLPVAVPRLPPYFTPIPPRRPPPAPPRLGRPQRLPPLPTMPPPPPHHTLPTPPRRLPPHWAGWPGRRPRPARHTGRAVRRCLATYLPRCRGCPTLPPHLSRLPH